MHGLLSDLDTYVQHTDCSDLCLKWRSHKPEATQARKATQVSGIKPISYFKYFQVSGAYITCHSTNINSVFFTHERILYEYGNFSVLVHESRNV